MSEENSTQSTSARERVLLVGVSWNFLGLIPVFVVVSGLVTGLGSFLAFAVVNIVVGTAVLWYIRVDSGRVPWYYVLVGYIAPPAAAAFYYARREL